LGRVTVSRRWYYLMGNFSGEAPPAPDAAAPFNWESIASPGGAFSRFPWPQSR
jgi:hypothetical protein